MFDGKCNTDSSNTALGNSNLLFVLSLPVCRRRQNAASFVFCVSLSLYFFRRQSAASLILSLSLSQSRRQSAASLVLSLSFLLQKTKCSFTEWYDSLTPVTSWNPASAWRGVCSPSPRANSRPSPETASSRANSRPSPETAAAAAATAATTIEVTRGNKQRMARGGNQKVVRGDNRRGDNYRVTRGGNHRVVKGDNYRVQGRCSEGRWGKKHFS